MIHQRLNFHQQRPRAFPHHHHRTAGGDLIATAEENGRWVADFTQALFCHGENAQFIHRTKAVFVAAQGTKTRIGVAVQQHRAVNTVFQNFRPGQRAVFGDVSHHHNRHTARLGEARQVGGGFTHLRYAARRRLNVRHVHHLDGVNHHQFRLFLLGNQADLLDTGFRQHIQAASR
ncbi:hypothetical protein D3C81_1373150 [compost metagenome]